METKERVAVRSGGSIMILELLDADILDEVVINEITESLFTILEQEKPQCVVLSFNRVRHLSSMAIGMLVRLNTRAAEAGTDLKLSDFRPALLELFEITKMNKVFSIYDTCEKAFASFS